MTEEMEKILGQFFLHELQQDAAFVVEWVGDYVPDADQFIRDVAKYMERYGDTVSDPPQS